MHYVIGDVHGCFDELQLLLDKIEKKDPEAVFFFVGDWIDRGGQVPEVIQWVIEHITLTGKYRSVRGNHDQEALSWYHFCLIPWSKKEYGERGTIPETQYDFSSVVDQYYNGNPEGLEPFFEKVSEEMPYNRAIDITTASGKKVTYRICHAWYLKDSNMSMKAKQFVNLYDREHSYCGNRAEGEIIVHGHTPTISANYRMAGNPKEERPGMIIYRKNEINVDGGCCYHQNFPGLACMLCAVCLETLEEFYPYSLEERILQGAKLQAENCYMNEMKDLSYEDKIQAIYKINMRRYQGIEPSYYRDELIENLR